MAGIMSKVSGLTRILSVVAVLAIVVAVGMVLLSGGQRKTLTASFPRTVSLYQGSDVRVLGVPIGTVDSVTPEGTDVVVKMSYDPKYKIPADAKAVIVSPSIVGDRFVQLTPVYKGGPVLADGAVLSERRTATPLELDQIYQSLDDLSVALGPQGANKQGALTRLLDSTARNYAGEGAQLHTTIKNLSRFTGTLAGNRQALFGTARQLERFVSALSKNDRTVRRFNDSLASAADLAKGERADLSAALRNLGVAMQQVSGFVRENKTALSKNIKGLDRISKILVKQRAALDETLRVAPTALTNLFHTYNPETGTLDTRTNIGENVNDLTSDPATVLCGILHQANAPKTACDALRKALPRAGALTSAAATGKPVQVEHIDRSLAGIVEVKQ